MSDLCVITPISAFTSTNLSSKIDCFQELGARILRLLGHPMINVELHPDQLYDAISMACEFFTQYAGWTKEWIIFDSRLYTHNVGIRLDHLYTVAHTGFNKVHNHAPNCAPCNDTPCAPCLPNPDFNVCMRDNLFISMSSIPSTYFASSSALSAAMIPCGVQSLQILDEYGYIQITTEYPELSAYFKMSPGHSISIATTKYVTVSGLSGDVTTAVVECAALPGECFNNMFDYDIMDYRKVMEVADFEEGTTNGLGTLFSMEQTLAQQTFYSYAMGNFGFDLLSWHCVKDWQDTREKLLALRRDIHFDNRTQYLRFFPQPRHTHEFVGVLECYVERPLRDIIKEKWVLEYATALAKVMWGRILTRIGSVQLLGGGIINGDLILQEGNTDKLRLEEMLMTGAGGFAAYEPPMMFVR